jgi:hypothetical protein
MHKHIPTLTFIYYKTEDVYAYRYDDINGNTQEQGIFPNLDKAAGDAVRHLKTFTLIEGLEEA